MTYEELVKRFVIEPRADYFRNSTWLVVYDSESGKYLMDGKAYRRFKSSTDVLKYLSERCY